MESIEDIINMPEGSTILVDHSAPIAPWCNSVMQQYPERRYSIRQRAGEDYRVTRLHDVNADPHGVTTLAEGEMVIIPGSQIGSAEYQRAMNYAKQHGLNYRGSTNQSGQLVITRHPDGYVGVSHAAMGIEQLSIGESVFVPAPGANSHAMQRIREAMQLSTKLFSAQKQRGGYEITRLDPLSPQDAATVAADSLRIRRRPLGNLAVGDVLETRCGHYMDPDFTEVGALAYQGMVFVPDGEHRYRRIA